MLAPPANPVSVDRRPDAVPDLPPPLVLWHGLGDSCHSEGMDRITQVLQDTLPGVHVHLVCLDEDEGRDADAGLLGDVVEQVAAACRQLAEDPKLANGFNALGFSQGGVFLRGVVEMCTAVQVRTLVTFGSPHLGVADLPTSHCGAWDWVCRQRDRALKAQVWREAVQHLVVPAQYFRTWDTGYDQYLEHLHYLAHLNSERPHANLSRYAEQMLRLTQLVLVMFDQDTVLKPKELAWVMGDTDASGEMYRFEDTVVYRNDTFGLRLLHTRGRVAFHTVDDEHMRFSDEFLSKMARAYLG